MQVQGGYRLWRVSAVASSISAGVQGAGIVQGMQFSLKEAVEAELVIKKSRFIAKVQPVSDRAQAQEVVGQLWQAHPDARHICWALMAGGQSAAVDDGEPSGTAGRPMLEVLRHQQLEGVLATVVRYFGGVKLGAGGLVRAYTDSVAQALLKAEKIPCEPMVQLHFCVDYAQEGAVRHLLHEAGAMQADFTHAERVVVRAQILQRAQLELTQRLADLTQGSVRWL